MVSQQRALGTLALRVAGRCALAIALGALTACGGKKVVRLPPPAPAIIGATEEGIASWYGHPYHGRRTSNGEIYDMEQMTAAHLRLPFDSWVRVTNLRTGRAVDVRINDRGPFVKNRIIDLSRAAARQIGMLGPGTARVRVEVIAKPGVPGRDVGTDQPSLARDRSGQANPLEQDVPPDRAAARCPEEAYFVVQVGSFRSAENAQRLLDRMQDRYGVAEIVQDPGGRRPLFRVMVGRETDFAAIQSLLARLRADQVEGFVTRVDRTTDSNCL